MGKKSSTAQDQSTQVKTETITTVGDIGLTGTDAVEVVALLQEGAALQIEKIGEALSPVIQETGAGFRQLVGGATDLVKVAEQKVAESVPIGVQITRSLPLIVIVAGVVFSLKALK